MRKMTFKKFFQGNLDKYDHVLYVLRNRQGVLYVGISQSGVWNRWFSQRGHMPRNGWGEFSYTSSAGRAVVENFPKSWKWKVELWTLKDCRKFFKSPSLSLRTAEYKMIEHLHPIYNVIGNC